MWNETKIYVSCKQIILKQPVGMTLTLNRIQDFVYENWKILLSGTVADTKVQHR
jgi:hypothetical protein